MSSVRVPSAKELESFSARDLIKLFHMEVHERAYDSGNWFGHLTGPSDYSRWLRYSPRSVARLRREILRRLAYPPPPGSGTGT